MKSKKKIVLFCSFAAFMASIVVLIFFSAKRPLWQLWLSPDVYNAIKAGNASQVEGLMQRGANPNRHGAGGLVGGTPVSWAIGKSDVSILKVLIKYGGDVNSPIDGSTPLEYALLVHRNNSEQRQEMQASAQIIRLLKQAGAREKAHAQPTTPFPHGNTGASL